MSRKLEGMKSDLNTHMLNAIDSAIEKKVILSIRNGLGGQTLAENTNMDLRSDGPHPSTFSQVCPQRDLRSKGPHQQIAVKVAQDTKKDFPRLVARSSNQTNQHRENAVDSNQSDDDDGYDMVTGANLTPQIVPPFLTGRPMRSRNNSPSTVCQ